MADAQLTSTSYKVTAASQSSAITTSTQNANWKSQILAQLFSDPNVTAGNDLTSSNAIISFNVTYKTETQNNVTTKYAIVSVTKKSS